MDTLPLPPRPDLEQYRKRARSLVVAANADDPDAVRRWASDWLSALSRHLHVEITPFVQGSFDRAIQRLTDAVAAQKNRAGGGSGTFALADAQHLIAQAHSYETWGDFAREVEALRSNGGTSDFERAADAVVTGDLATLEDLLQRNPGLVRERSTRQHKVTLLHYVAANGVEDFRQKTLPNAVAIAERLIAAGAEVDAIAETYGGGTYQTTMNLLVSSAHPAEAGLQSTLVEVLLDHGAAVDGVANDCSPILTALSFGYRQSAETLARRGAAINHVVVAAAMGRLDLMRAWVIDADNLAKEHGAYRGPYWVPIPADTKGQIAMALVWACRFGRGDVVRFLLERGVDASAQDRDQMTALHWASASGLVDVIDLLLAHGAPLEVRNTWGGTVLDSTIWFAVNAPMPGTDYPRIIEALLRAGADPNQVYPSTIGVPEIDQVLERYRRSRRA